MKKFQLLIAAAILSITAVSSAYAGTSFWLSTDPSGATVPGDTVSVAAGQQVTLYCYMSTDQAGNTFETMIGYDTSDATSYGAGKDSNNGAKKKLTLASSKSGIVSSIDSYFDAFLIAGYASSQVVLDASGREDTNINLGGRPYGFIVRAAKRGAANVPLTKKLFSFSLTNNMPEGQSQKVIISNCSGANAFSSAWKYGVGLGEDSYALTVVSGTTGSKPVVGASNKAVLDVIMNAAVQKYMFVFWGKVQDATSSSFKIDDGSGVVLTVNGENNVSNGNYVSVKGNLDPSTRTITNPQITVQKQ